MNSVQIEENVKNLVKQVSSQEISKDDFVYELLLAYGHRKSVVSRVKSGERNLAKTAGEVILKRHLYFKPCNSNLFAEIDALKNSKTVATNKIRFVVVTDFSQLIAIDTKTQDTLDIELGQLAKHFDFFLPWAGMEKMVYRGENPADVKAAEKMADFFDHIKATNYPVNATKEQLHEMVVFLNRLLFCFFAEDTKIFSENQFTNLMNQHTQEDGSDLVGVFERLFDVLNTPAHQRNDLPKYLNDFPYVNGGLFKKQIKVPTFDAKARRMLLDSGTLDWSDINPDIFGSMIQGVADPETRSKMGMHYTSVSNIMKVIEPLFLNDLYEEFDKCNDNINKLKKLQVRLSRIKFFDPACGSGNFLIITYKEIRELEIEILKRIRELEGESDSGMMGLFDESHSAIRLDQFYGIELDDFAHEMAILSLWLVEHQMNMVFETEFGYTAPTLPLKQSGRIVAGNATRIDWELVCSTDDQDEVYILGNPPYIGNRYQEKEHKSDLENILISVNLKKSKNLDYIACWFIKAESFVRNRPKSAFAFVTTSSICQGVQVELLWPYLLSNGAFIHFAYQPFKWKNNAKDNAGVSCAIIGIKSNDPSKQAELYNERSRLSVKNINGYLLASENIVVTKRLKPLTHRLKMDCGSKATDGGNLLISSSQIDEVKKSLDGTKFYDCIKPIVGAEEFLNGSKRWCLWFTGYSLEEVESNYYLNERIKACKAYRDASTKKATNKKASIPHLFDEIKHRDANTIFVPTVTSEKRKYLPVGYLDSNQIVIAPNNAVYEADLITFAILSSRMHMVWTKTVSGQLESRIRYSSSLCYNSFPLPTISENNKQRLEELALDILEVRESFPNLTIAKLYDSKGMPPELLEAHQRLDSAFEKLYQRSLFDSDEERLEALFKLYSEQTGVADA